MVRKFQNIAFGYAIPSYFHNIESTLHIYVHVYYITIQVCNKTQHPVIDPEIGQVQLET